MSTTKLMFAVRSENGMQYINPVESGNRIYKVKALVDKIGEWIDKFLFYNFD